MKKYTLLFMLLFLTACDNKTRSEKIQEILPKEYKYANESYSQADNKISITGTGGLSSIKDNINDAIALNFKSQFDEIRIIPSNDNYFRITGDSNVVTNVSYNNNKKVLNFDFKSTVSTTNNPLILEIYSNQINYIDNNNNNNIIFNGLNSNINIQNKGFLKISLNNASFKDFMTNNLGSIEIKGSGNAENLLITDFSMGKYEMQNFKSQNMNIKTRGMSSGVVNVSHIAMGEVGMTSHFKIVGHTQIKKVDAIFGGKIDYEEEK